MIMTCKTRNSLADVLVRFDISIERGSEKTGKRIATNVIERTMQ